MERWATFDCYGTLIDWNRGIRRELARVLGEEAADLALTRYHELEPKVQAEDPTRSYRDVMALTLEQLGVQPGERDALGRSLPTWPVFPEVPSALRETRRRGWRLCILSNTDRDLIEASIRRIGVPFEHAIVASEIGSYKPAHGHWRAFERETGRLPDVHVAASLFHDVGPARELGVPVTWVNRLGERSGPEPSREIADLSPLPDVLEELVPA